MQAAGWRELDSKQLQEGGPLPAGTGGGKVQRELHTFVGGGRALYLSIFVDAGQTRGATVLLQSSEGEH